MATKHPDDQSETKIIFNAELGDVEYPHCVIPPYFYERALKKSAEPAKPILSVQTWGGRDVFKVERPN